MKVSVCYTVFNEEQFLPYSLRSIYDFADEIVIIEGARGTYFWKKAKSDGSSTDRTVEIIKTFPDTKNKIQLVQKKWKDKLEMKNRLLKEARGDWILLCAGDEVYNPEELKQLRRFVKEHSEAVCIKFPFIHHIWNEDYQVITKRPVRELRDWKSRHQRFFKNMKGLRYKGSHSDVEDARGVFLISYPEHTQFWLPEIHIHHYAYTRSPEEIREKLTFYCLRDNAHKKHGFDSVEEYINSHPYFSRRGDPRMGEKIVVFEGKKLGVL